jgi:hypothetical protein
MVFEIQPKNAMPDFSVKLRARPSFRHGEYTAGARASSDELVTR